MPPRKETSAAASARRACLRVAIQGEPGSNSHLATEALLGSQPLVSCALSAEVFERLAHPAAADAAVLPIENSLHGAVADHYDLLLRHPVTIVGEVALRIHHALIVAPGVAFNTLRQVLSHPVALSQCRRFFQANPQLQAIPFHDTAGAARHIVESNDPALAAIAAPVAAQVQGGVVLRSGLEDDPQNFTRFFLLARAEDAEAVRSRSPQLGPADRLSIAFAIPHRPGSLVAALQLLAEQGADLTRIESRPVPGTPWQYVFFVDVRLPAPERGTATLDVLHEACTWVKLLGQYGVATSVERLDFSDATAGGGR